MPFTETYSSLIRYSSWIILGAVIGVAMLLRPGDSGWVDRIIAAIFFVQVIAIMSGTRGYPALRRGVLSIPYILLCLFSPDRPGSVPLAIPAYRVGRRLGCHKLARDGILACRRGLERAPENAGRGEGVSRKSTDRTIEIDRLREHFVSYENHRSSLATTTTEAVRAKMRDIECNIPTHRSRGSRSPIKRN